MGWIHNQERPCGESEIKGGRVHGDRIYASRAGGGDASSMPSQTGRPPAWVEKTVRTYPSGSLTSK